MNSAQRVINHAYVKRIQDFGNDEDIAVKKLQLIEDIINDSKRDLTTKEDLITMKDDLIRMINKSFYKTCGVLIGYFTFLLLLLDHFHK